MEDRGGKEREMQEILQETMELSGLGNVLRGWTSTRKDEDFPE